MSKNFFLRVWWVLELVILLNWLFVFIFMLFDIFLWFSGCWSWLFYLNGYLFSFLCCLIYFYGLVGVGASYFF
jgi:hypothetical protein